MGVMLLGMTAPKVSRFFWSILLLSSDTKWVTVWVNMDSYIVFGADTQPGSHHMPEREQPLLRGCQLGLPGAFA